MGNRTQTHQHQEHQDIRERERTERVRAEHGNHPELLHGRQLPTLVR